jgi:ribosomal protein S27E
MTLTLTVVICDKCGYKPIIVKRYQHWAICPVCSNLIPVRSR